MSDDPKVTHPGDVTDPARVTVLHKATPDAPTDPMMRCLPAAPHESDETNSVDAYWAAGLPTFTPDRDKVHGGWAHDADGVWRWISRAEAGPDVRLWVPGDPLPAPPLRQRVSATEPPSARTPEGAHWTWRPGEVVWEPKLAPAVPQRMDDARHHNSEPTAEEVINWMNSADPVRRRRGGDHVYRVYNKSVPVSDPARWSREFVKLHGIQAFLGSQHPRDWGWARHGGQEVLGALHLRSAPSGHVLDWRTAFDDAIHAKCAWPVAQLLRTWIGDDPRENTPGEAMLRYVQQPAHMAQLTRTVLDRALVPHAEGDMSLRVGDIADLAYLAAPDPVVLADCARRLEAALQLHLKAGAAGSEEYREFGSRLRWHARGESALLVMRTMAPVLRKYVPDYINSVFRAQVSQHELWRVASRVSPIAWTDDAQQPVFSKSQALDAVSRYLERLHPYSVSCISWLKSVVTAVQARADGEEVWRELGDLRARLVRKYRREKSAHDKRNQRWAALNSAKEILDHDNVRDARRSA